jgi:hypothetical protein
MVARCSMVVFDVRPDSHGAVGRVGLVRLSTPADWPPDRTTPAPLRLPNVMALGFLVFSSTWLRRVADKPALRFLLIRGRHPLEVLSHGTILAMLFRLIFQVFGATWMTQPAANGV